MDSPEHPSQSQVLPILSNETGQRVLEDLGMDIDGKTQGIIAGITGETKPSLHQTLNNLGMNVFTSVFGVNPELVRTLQHTIKGNLQLGNVDLFRTSCIEGMAVVIRAFDIESDFNLINKFADLKSEDMPRVAEIVAEGLGRKKERDLLESVLESPKIPEQQITLNGLVEKASRGTTSALEFNLGAATMYRLISEMKLYPPKTPIPPTDTPPQAGV